ncbi:phosphonopyruvate decarboxylase [Bacillus taeanensis]|uniref:Phosphonopyruvate decarboxylase n=1 Tax=Bacillus taeanensis TaxID=273032 RepID=A0A366XV37_9BACI|nr:phosphonopyruvate decarboxylase [Bacillus taeanensis]RBW69992.1 phosphonopyruvate decarboxylase [Bacillus taeanensis]
MIQTKRFGEELKRLGFNFFSGVPCSFLKYMINYAINDCEYVAAANEGDAVAIASGAYLGGKKSVVLMQNSGLTNAVSPLVSLNEPFKIPILGFVSLRGETGIQDEPQHELMGKITTSMLEDMNVRWTILSHDWSEAKAQLQLADSVIEQNIPFFFVIRKGTFAEEKLRDQPLHKRTNDVKTLKENDDQLPTRFEALQTINALKDQDTVQLATTGKTGRELYEVEDAPNNLYMVGSMGCISSLGLGLALVKDEKKVVVIDGDGSLLMRMGSLATNGYYSPKNMLHILLDNSTHDSTGGQTTVSPNVNFIDIASACGYSKVNYVHHLKELEERIKEWKENNTLTFLYMKIAKGSKNPLARPDIKPHEVKERLQVFLNG